MNLLEQYIPDYSGHIQGIKHNARDATLEIVFYDRPEEFNAVIKLIFEGVTALNEFQIDEPDDNCIELVIGLDEVHGGYCIHTDTRVINFRASKVESFAINT